MKSKIKLIYVTTGSSNEADSLATILIKENLIACANLLGKSKAIYRWGGKLIKENEVVLILKTTDKLVKKVLRRISDLHSYKCPAVIVLDVQDGNKEFFKWISSTADGTP